MLGLDVAEVVAHGEQDGHEGDDDHAGEHLGLGGTLLTRHEATGSGFHW